MCQNKQVPITLAIDDTSIIMQVIGFSGHDALNEPYSFEIDLLSGSPSLDFNALLQHTAYLNLGPHDGGIHGRIYSVSQRYAGTGISLYRVSLGPDLRRLQQPVKRRTFHHLSVPQLIVQLLTEQGLDDNAYRFEHTTGLYPPRALCVQYDESDLHLLQRVCEEEGIHFRFEHSRNQHLLIFSDDPASFPECQQPLHFQNPASGSPSPDSVSHLHERLWALPGYSPPQIEQDDSADADPGLTAEQKEWGANQPYRAPAHNTTEPCQLRQRQLGTRTLERLRCERYQVEGRTNQAVPGSGHILQVLDHPMARYNDQWLISTITHQAWQPEALEQCNDYDRARILDSASPAPAQPGYANSFTAIPWAMPFRPTLNHPKPQIHGYLPATLCANTEGLLASDALGRLPIRFDWQADTADTGCSMAQIADIDPRQLIAGTALWVSHFDNDPDRPLICGLREQPSAQSKRLDRRFTLHLDGVRIDSAQHDLHLQPGQCLQVDASNLSLTGDAARIELSSDGIDLNALDSLE